VRVVVVGARGQLGAMIVHEFSAGHDVIALGRAELDITDDGGVAEMAGRLRPGAIINCAAYNYVDLAEDAPVDALNSNAIGVRALARAARDSGAVFVHYSTDFVFDGAASSPYVETDRTNPRSTYAASKLMGEWLALDAPRAYVLRVESLFGRAPGAGPAKGSVAGIVDAMRAGREVKVFEDRTVSPTFVVDGARATRALIEAKAAPGLYHCVNSGYCTWLEFAQEAARQLGVSARILPIRLDEVKLRAARPKFCALSNAKLMAAGVSMPAWQDALARYLADDRSARL
jgi:dTDP-4-dehydrorhamnose reductase